MSFKLVSARIAGQTAGTEKKTDPKLVGETSLVNIEIDGISTSALCDTGSCVSTCSDLFFKQNFPDKEVKPLSTRFEITCADGSQLPYKGYIEADLEAIGIPDSKKQLCLFLVVPDTDFNQSTPFLLGTNILNELLENCKEHHGVQFLQRAKLFTPWFTAFRCMSMREKELKRNKNKIATVRSAETRVRQIGPNQSINITCISDKEIDHQPTCAIITDTENTTLPNFIDITPAVVHCDNINKKEIIVNLSNLTTNTVNIAPRAIIAELQPVTIDEAVYKDIQKEHKSALEEIHIGDGLTAEQDKLLRDLLKSHEDIFSTGETDIGQCNLVKHRIELENEIPFKQRHRRIPPGMIEEVRKHLEQLLAGGVIRKSKSPFASNIVIVRKKSGKLRMCVDYRMLNNRTIKDAYALPRVEEVFDCLHGAKYFSTIDMKSGYHQVEVEEKHKERTAFTVGPLGFYEFNKMPFGLSNSPATYQRLMEECLGDFNMKICVIYLDDLIIFSDSFEQHLERLNMILTRLKECGIKLSPEKCFFIQRKVHFLGHVVGEDGIETDPEKIEKIKNYPKPTNPERLKSFLAFCGYYRKFVKDFAKLIRPLSDLIPPTSPKKRSKANQEPVVWKWEEKHDRTFEELKRLLTSPPILAYPNFDLPFELHTDASTHGLGAVLYQEQEGQKKVIAYASRSLTRSEKNYSAFKLEFLALKWSITEKFSDYLLGNKFIVYTDNNPLTYVLTSAKLEATGQRWVATLSDFDFDIKYRPGVLNIDSDVMSRYPTSEHGDEHIEETPTADCDKDVEETIDSKTIKAICNTIYVTPFIEVLPHMDINIVESTDSPGQTLAQIEVREIRTRQREDPGIGVWYRAVMDKEPPKKQLLSDDPKHQTMSRNFKNFHMIRGILHRKTQDNGKEINQLVLPSCYKAQVLQGLHNDVGHPGKERTGSLVRERFYWPGYMADVDKHVQTCGRCLRRKSTTSKAPLVNIESRYPLERVCMDYLTVDPCQGSIENILVITDHYTKYSVAVPTRNQTAKTTAEALLNNFILHYGIPSKLHSDQGRNFESDLMKELCQLMDIKKTRTTIYHPMCNGQTERYNRTLLNMLGTLEPEKKQNWKKYIPTLVYAYNATRHESTGYSPFELMFGRNPKLPLDSVFHLDKNADTITSDYVKDLKERLELSHELANKSLKKARQKQKVQFDKKAKATQVNVGDTVLVKILAYEGKHKIADKFEQDTYKVVKQPNRDIPVYIVRNGDGNEKRLHRNHLLPIEVADDVDENDDKEDERDRESEKVQKNRELKPVPKPRRGKETPVIKTPVIDSKEDSDESDVEFVDTYSSDSERPAGPDRVSSLDSTSRVSGTDSADRVGSSDKVCRESVSDKGADKGVTDPKERTEEVSKVKDIPDAHSAKAVVGEPEDEEIEEEEKDDDEETGEDDSEVVDLVPVPRVETVLEAPPAEPPPPQPPPRKSTRDRKKPAWYGDYVMSQQVDKSDELRKLLQEQAVLNAKVLQTVLNT